MGPGAAFWMQQQAMQQANYEQQARLQQQAAFGLSPFANAGRIPAGTCTYSNNRLGDYLLEQNRQELEQFKYRARAGKYRRDVHGQWWRHGVRVSWVDVRRDLCPVYKRAHLRKVARKRWKVLWRWWRANWRWIL